jgi:hypothetical protein
MTVGPMLFMGGAPYHIPDDQRQAVVTAMSDANWCSWTWC